MNGFILIDKYKNAVVIDNIPDFMVNKVKFENIKKNKTKEELKKCIMEMLKEIQGDE